MKANESPVKVENIPHPSLAMDKTPGTLLNMKKSGKRMFIPQKDGEQLMLTTMKPILTTIKLWISWGKTHVNHAKKTIFTITPSSRPGGGKWPADGRKS
jgi:hypothetical protein